MRENLANLWDWFINDWGWAWVLGIYLGYRFIFAKRGRRTKDGLVSGLFSKARGLARRIGG